MFNIRKLILISAVLITLIGCSNNRFSNLISQAESHYKDAEYASAIAVYEKALDIKEDKEARSALEKIEKEVTRIQDMRDTYNKLNTARQEHVNIISKQELFDFINDVRGILIEVNNFDTKPDDLPSYFVDKFRDSYEYEYLTRALEIVEGTHTIGLKSSNVVSDADKIGKYIDDLLEKYPLPHGFNS
ncbi:hypothetical protein ACFQ3Y_15740 [Paenibacillus motobuensis]|uniref:hypothetical protein n=1 Tax=Paenibacillus motobuensis TaxID=295324 RepID=UPI00363B4079